MSSGTNSLLNTDKNCATITINVSDFYTLIHRIKTQDEQLKSQDERLSRLEQHIIVDRREVLRKELATLEDGFQLRRTYEKRVR